jgi:two-component system response regulator HydG
LETNHVSSTPRILVVDDDREHAATLARLLRREQFDAEVVHDVHAALNRLRTDPPDVVLTDLVMPGATGLDLLRAVSTLHLDVDVILMTAFGTVERSVEAMREGAVDFIAKPISRAGLMQALTRALGRRRLQRENAALRDEVQRLRGATSPIGNAPAFTRALALARQAAASDATVLLLGESGTGKEVVARDIHATSKRADGPFVAVHCAALPESIIESELFGHEQGSFTGASRRRIGVFEAATGGTLLLDEIGELSQSVQVKLLRVLQEGEIVRVGGNAPIKVNVRIVAATHQNLSAMVREGRFREDLFYRLNVIPVTLPPLRERPEDIELLAHVLAARHGQGPPLRFSPAALSAMRAWSWPGNVRELENTVQRALVLDTNGVLDVDDLPAAIGETAASAEHRPTVELTVGTPLAEAERRLILATLEHVRGDKSLAAALLGVGRRTIYRKLDEYGLAGTTADADDSDDT